LFGFLAEESLQQAVSNWKRYTARHAKIEWQRDFFDHRLRHDESYAQKADYIRQNPGRKGLVARAEDWPYVIENNRW
jgi:putative transposase